MANDLTLAVETRDKKGSTDARRTRSGGKVPGVVYGHGTAPEFVIFEGREFELVLNQGGRTGLIKLKGGSKRAESVLVREIQRHPVSQKVLHADLQRVSAHETVHAKLPIVTVGTARGVRDSGGVMDVVLHEIEIEGPVDKLPDRLEVDVNELGIHDHILASDVQLPEGFKLLTGAETIIVSIEPSRTAQAVEEAAVTASLEQAEPEVIGEKAPEAAAEGGA